MKGLASKRLRKRRGPLVSAEEMMYLLDESESGVYQARRVREATRTRSDVTLTVSYPNGDKHPSIWNWQFMASKFFPDAEVEIRSWTTPHPDW